MSHDRHAPRRAGAREHLVDAPHAQSALERQLELVATIHAGRRGHVDAVHLGLFRRELREVRLDVLVERRAHEPALVPLKQDGCRRRREPRRVVPDLARKCFDAGDLAVEEQLVLGVAEHNRVALALLPILSELLLALRVDKGHAAVEPGLESHAVVREELDGAGRDEDVAACLAGEDVKVKARRAQVLAVAGAAPARDAELDYAKRGCDGPHLRVALRRSVGRRVRVPEVDTRQVNARHLQVDGDEFEAARG
mmetsp:Transcript_25597/g.85993  ORF Transcript_25597/g.85993 Transcript_25597/m.85993 type:complete len:253 (-) Transcript_25597:97-855(-)